MSILSIRFRNEGALVVLQVSELIDRGSYGYGPNSKWRDATTEDLLNVAQFTNDPESLMARVANMERITSEIQNARHDMSMPSMNGF